MSAADRELVKAGPAPVVPTINRKADAEFATEMDRRYQHTVDSNRERVERLKQAGMKFDNG